MDKIRYYFGWFNGTVPEKIAQSLLGDMTCKKSLAIISGTPTDYETTDKMVALAINVWFGPAGIVFDSYHTIDYRMEKERIRDILKNASVILLHGGNPVSLNDFLCEYGMSETIKNSNATVVMGASAGAMNMSAKWVDDWTEEIKIRDGLGLDSFAIEPHAIFDGATALANDEHIKNNIMPLSENVDMYVACEESTIRIKNGKLESMGDVYLISKSSISQLKDSLCV